MTDVDVSTGSLAAPVTGPLRGSRPVPVPVPVPVSVSVSVS
ncbi:hypothetical protein [Streptomyces hainanensis]|nr:hypothetical protein [Streptomyces hainanensis]